jgi:hypothetical protein
MKQQSLVGLDLLSTEASRSQWDTAHLLGLSGRVISPVQRPLADNTRNSQERDIHASGGIRTSKSTP